MGEQLRTYFAEGIGRIAGFIPNLVSAIAILVIGYVLARVVGSVCRRLLSRARFDQFVGRHVHAGAGERRSPSGTVGKTVFWLGMLVTLSLASRSLGLLTLNAGLNRILSFVPRVIVAAIIVGVAFAIGNVLADLVSGVGGGILAKGVRVAVIALAVFMALDELGIASGVVRTAFAALVGTAAVAAAIAFGVGNIPLARDYSQRMVSRRRERYGVGPTERYGTPPPPTRREPTGPPPTRTH